MWRNWAVAGIPKFAMFPGASTEGKLATFTVHRGCLEFYLTTSNVVNIPIMKNNSYLSTTEARGYKTKELYNYPLIRLKMISFVLYQQASVVDKYELLFTIGILTKLLVVK